MAIFLQIKPITTLSLIPMLKVGLSADVIDFTEAAEKTIHTVT
jgi:hypothetical protein